MELEVMKKLIKKYTAGHGEFLTHAGMADRYYRNKTDILLRPLKKKGCGSGRESAA